MLHSLHIFLELIWSMYNGCMEDWILCGEIVQTFFCPFWSDCFPRWRHIRKSSSVVFAQLFGMSPHHESPEFTFFRSIRGGEDIPVGEISLVLCVVVILITVTFFAKSSSFAKAATEAVVTLDVDRAVRWIEFSCICHPCPMHTSRPVLNADVVLPLVLLAQPTEFSTKRALLVASPYLYC